jgi:nucleotide-binding universal stress UspA family protein
MIDIRRILCPVDFSQNSQHALEDASTLAGWYEATLDVVYVHPIVTVTTFAEGLPLLPAAALLTPADREAVQRSLLDFTAPHLRDGVRMECRVREGEPSAEILEEIREKASDLVVIGTHGRSGVRRLLLGSVTERVLRQAACPVMTIPPRLMEAPPLRSALFKRVLCATDFSPCSMSALSYATSIAQESGGELAVMHVMEVLPEEMGSESSWATGRTFADYIASARAATLARLEQSIPAAVRETCKVDLVHVSGKPYREILREAAARQSDLIVVGVHGRNPLGMLFFGSTSHQLVRHAACAVMTVRAE